MMKKILFAVCIVVVLGAGIVIGYAVNSSLREEVNIEQKIIETAGSAGFLVAIVDDQRVMQEAKVYQSLKKDYESRIAKLQAEVDKEKEKLKKENDRIAGKRSSLSQEQFDKEVEGFAKKQEVAEEKIKAKIRALESAYVTAINKVKVDGVDKVLTEIAVEQKLSMISSRMVALYYNDALDITQSVIDRLNKKMSKASLDIK